MCLFVLGCFMLDKLVHEMSKSKFPLNLPLAGRSPDLNPIELVWHALKEFVRREAKPWNKAELLQAIVTFWTDHLTKTTCNKYIDHLQKVLPAVVQRDGGSTGM